MAGGGRGGVGARELDHTPTWAVSLVCFVIILISILLENVLHIIGAWFQRKRKKALYEALMKIKGELMVLGFISLLMTFGQNYIAKICIPTDLADTMLPCLQEENGTEVVTHEMFEKKTDPFRGHLWSKRRFLAGGEGGSAECKEGHVPLISLNGLHQLHIFIFFLAVFHVIYSAITMLLGKLKIREWKEWEQETVTEHEMMNDPTRFRLTHQTSFVKNHTNNWMKISVTFYIVCFFRQFFRSVRRADYLTMRHGFISVHLAPGSKFNFQKYIKRSLEDDFKVVVGISPVLWGSLMLFLLLNVHGWAVMYFVTVLPLIVILAVGTKLQGIISQMAIEITERHAVIQGIPLVKVSDSYFWFSWPELILHLIHFVLFQNAFEITYFLWIWHEFGLRSCFHDDFRLSVARVILGIGVQFLCSYSTLPLYALVTQMGSTMKKSIFDEQTSKALKQWHKAVVNKRAPSKAEHSSSSIRRLFSTFSSKFESENAPTSSSMRRSSSSVSSIVEARNAPNQTANIVASVDNGNQDQPNDRGAHHHLDSSLIS